jgi:hypothetical protein
VARLSTSTALICALLAVTPLHAQQSGDMFGSGPKLDTGQPDMFRGQSPSASTPDMFSGQSSGAPARDMFPQQTPDAPSADMFDGVPQAKPGAEDRFSVHGMTSAPPYPLFHNPNANDQ